MWTRIDDGAPASPKLLKAGPVASWFWVCGLCYCGRHLTDGFIPEEALPTLGSVRYAKVEAAVLVKVGLWERVAGGYQVHDFLDFNESRAETLARRDTMREQRRKAGLASGFSRRKNKGQNTERNTNGPVHVSFEHTHEHPVEPPLNPIQSNPISTKKEQAQKYLSSADADLERFRSDYPVSRRVGGRAARKAWVAASSGRNGTHFQALLTALAQHKRSVQWRNPKYIPLMTTWLRGEYWKQVLPEDDATDTRSASPNPDRRVKAGRVCAGCGHTIPAKLSKCSCGHVREAS